MNYIKLKTVDSTNKYAKELAKNGAPDGTVVIADSQTGGYGRMGRSFVSPEGSGLYMSIILRPKLAPQKALYITAAAAVAVSDAIEELYGKTASIKWVNDVYINDKKVSGILTEAAFISNEQLEYAILGIGVNIFSPEHGFPDEIKEIAGAVFDFPVSVDVRDKLAERIYHSFMTYYENLEIKGYLERYRLKSFIPNSDVTVISASGSYNAHALGIDDEFKLIIKKQDSTVIHLDSGEVSVRRTT